jgi:trk system potassium uptake protein TrkH
VVGLLLLIGIGSLVLRLPPMAQRHVTLGEAVFTATSAVTVTGLGLSPTAVTWSLPGQITILVLVQLGGAGFMVALVLALRLLGQRASLADRLALTSELGLDSPRAVVTLMQRTVGMMLAVEVVGAVLLFVNWSRAGVVSGAQGAFYAIFHAVTAFCNAGFDLFSGLPQYPDGLPRDTGTLAVLGVLILVGGLGIPVYMEAASWRRRRRVTLHSRLTLVAAATLMTMGMVALLAAEYRRAGVLTGAAPAERVVQAWFQSVSARTAGFAGLMDFEELSQASQLALVGLMFVGTAPASMGGGITTGTLVVLLLAAASYAGGHRAVRVRSRVLSQASVWRASVILLTSLAAVFTATWLVLLSHDTTLASALFEVVSAFSTTGLSMGLTTELNAFGRGVIMFMMFWGRVGAATLVVAMLQRQARVSRVDYPEESVLVG